MTQHYSVVALTNFNLSLQTKSQAELVPFLCHDSKIRERFSNVLLTFSCVIFPGISCFLNEWNSRNHIIILLAEFLVNCMRKYTSPLNVHYSRESPVSIWCTQLVLFLRKTQDANLCHSWVLFGGILLFIVSSMVKRSQNTYKKHGLY